MRDQPFPSSPLRVLLMNADNTKAVGEGYDSVSYPQILLIRRPFVDSTHCPICRQPVPPSDLSVSSTHGSLELAVILLLQRIKSDSTLGRTAVLHKADPGSPVAFSPPGSSHPKRGAP